MPNKQPKPINENPPARTASGKAVFTFGYLNGLVSAVLIAFLIFGFVAYRLGPARFLDELGDIVDLALPRGHERVLYMPSDVLDDLTRMGAVIENADDPTKQPRHETLMVQPDKELGFVLKPNVSLRVDVLSSTKALNFDPPVLHVAKDSKLPARLADYLRQHSRLTFHYSTDDGGRRTTLPRVSSDRKLLLIGDSVAFGVGVDDGATLASALQRKLDDQYRVINAGVGSYNGRQCFLTALRQSRENQFSGLIYTACQNDFGYSTEAAEAILEGLATISDRFSGHVIVTFHTYMEYSMRDVFLRKGLSPKRLKQTTALSETIKRVSAENGFEYVDWADLINRYRGEQKNLFAGLALYGDHCHMSPLGNQVMAERLYAALVERGLVDARRAAGTVGD